jgi:hypothetical protein
LTLASVGTLGCKGSAEATATERLWVSALPTSPKSPIAAFLTTRTSNGKYTGAFFQGTLLRGGHDVFTWRESGKDTATLQFLQDGRTVHLKIEWCEPSRGFDHCLLLRGDPTGTVRYQSRKRWAVRRPGRRKDLGAGIVMGTLLELAEDDEDLQLAVSP